MARAFEARSLSCWQSAVSVTRSSSSSSSWSTTTATSMQGSCPTPTHTLTCNFVSCLPFSPAAYADAQLSVKSQGESTGTDAWAGQHKPDFDRRLLRESAASPLACLQHSLRLRPPGLWHLARHALMAPSTKSVIKVAHLLPRLLHPSLSLQVTRPAKTSRTSVVVVAAKVAPTPGNSGAPTGNS